MLNRNLKPAHALLDTGGTTRIANSGLSSVFRVPRSDGARIHRPVSESVRGDKYRYPTDIFSLGCISYELLFGCVPIFVLF